MGYAKVREKRLLDMRWDIDYKRFVGKKEEYNENCMKAYALTYD